MTMTDEQKAEAADRRAEAARVAYEAAEREYQASLSEDDFAPESWRAISYCNAQLLNPLRSSDREFLRDTRDIHLRQGARNR